MKDRVGGGFLGNKESFSVMGCGMIVKGVGMTQTSYTHS